MMKDNMTAVTSSLQAIPKPRLVYKIIKSIFGVFFILVAIAAAYFEHWPWYVVLGLAMFGAHIVSEDLTRKAIEFLVAVVKDLLASIGRK